MEITAQSIADFLHGTVVGDANARVSSAARIEQGRPGTICFFANPKYEHYVYDNKASIILVNNTFEPKQPVSATMIKVENAYEAVASLLEYISSLKKSTKRGNRWLVCRPLSSSIGKGTNIGRQVIIGKHVKIGKYCRIYPQVYLGDNVKVGSNVIIYPGVRIYHDCVIGDNCILQANCVIGADGFGFAPREDGSYKKIPQTGNVVLEDDVEVGANTTVDRATMGSTIVHKGVKLDNLCQVAHNVEIGDNTVMAALSGLAGSAKIGKQCIIGGQSSIVGHITVADHTTIAARTGVIGNVRKEGEILLGYPAIDHKEYMKAYAIFKSNAKK